jgi:dTDP-4-dehydrorhamnose reductase
MRILLLGASGQVGGELRRALAPLGSLIAWDRKAVDLGNLSTLRRKVRDLVPDLIVNAAAYTAVDKAESEPELAYRVNAEAVEVLAGEAKHLGAWVVHYSTEYVFDGKKVGAYTETDPTHPLSTYGRSKLRGEEAVRNSGSKYLLFRTSWVYAAHGKNFPKTILRLAKQRDELRVVSDQIGAPTSARLIAEVTAHALYKICADGEFAEKATGTYHVTAGGTVSWHRYAQFVLRTAIANGNQFKIVPDEIVAISTDEYPTPATRPRNSCLDTHKVRKTFGVDLPDWEAPVTLTVRQILAQKTPNDT